jgi:hypothetical protein
MITEIAKLTDPFLGPTKQWNLLYL